jgi:hypothetical protein
MKGLTSFDSSIHSISRIKIFKFMVIIVQSNSGHHNEDDQSWIIRRTLNENICKLNESHQDAMPNYFLCFIAGCIKIV